MKRLILFSAIIVFLAITVLSLMPPKSEIRIPTNDKVGHFIAYTVFSLNVCLVFPVFNKRLFFVLLAIVIYGIVIEILQGYVGRTCSFYDFLANTSGVLIGFVLFTLFGKRILNILYKKSYPIRE